MKRFARRSLKYSLKKSKQMTLHPRKKKMSYFWRWMVFMFTNRTLLVVAERLRMASFMRGGKKRIQVENQFENYPSFATLLTEKTRHAIGAIQGHMPALTSSDQNKPYAHALRGLAGF